MPTPTFSVIIPCYNLGQYLDEAVDSVLAQSVQDFEIVIVNDGSTDTFTNQLLERYDRPHTRVITTPNRGVMAARNTAIEHSTGRYICALDADDALKPLLFERALAILDTDDSVAWVSCWLRAFGDEEWEWTPERCDLVMLLGEQTVCTAAPVRRSAVLAVGGYDERMPHPGLEDWEFWINLSVHGYRGVILPEVLFRYRQRANSLSKKAWFGEWHVETFRFILEKHRSAYEAHLFDILARREDAACGALNTVYGLEREINTWLQPLAGRKAQELALLESKMTPPVPVDVPPDERRHWKSWPIMAPARVAYRYFRRMRAVEPKTP